MAQKQEKYMESRCNNYMCSAMNSCIFRSFDVQKKNIFFNKGMQSILIMIKNIEKTSCILFITTNQGSFNLKFSLFMEQ